MLNSFRLLKDIRSPLVNTLFVKVENVCPSPTAYRYATTVKPDNVTCQSSRDDVVKYCTSSTVNIPQRVEKPHMCLLLPSCKGSRLWPDD